MGTFLDKAIEHLRESAGPALSAQAELRDEIALLFTTAAVDRSMALGRARRLLEVMVVDHYIRWKPLAPPYRGKIEKLYELIEELALTAGAVRRPAASLCHAVRMEGNRALHYAPVYPGEPKWARFTEEGLVGTLLKLLEIAETFGTGGWSVYASSLSEPFGELYGRLRRDWEPALGGKREEGFPLFEALDLFFRSVVPSMRPEWLEILGKRADDEALPERTSAEETEALRQLRNLGLVGHDGPWLFTPTRSKKVWPTPAGHVFLALSGRPVPSDPESVAREVVKRFHETLQDREAVDLLEAVKEGRPLEQGQKPVARRLRNLHLVRHDSYFLEGAETLTLTDLGYYVLGKCSPE